MKKIPKQDFLQKNVPMSIDAALKAHINKHRPKKTGLLSRFSLKKSTTWMGITSVFLLIAASIYFPFAGNIYTSEQENVAVTIDEIDEFIAFLDDDSSWEFDEL